MKFSNYHKATEYLIHEIPKTAREVFDDEATIRKNFEVMELLHNPQYAHPAVHVAGTSGKGTICYLIDSLLRAHSKRTGMTQSPHVYDIRERIQINGQLISENSFVRALNAVTSHTAAASVGISYFETLTAMGFLAFAKENLDYVILETGLGGRLDASNVIDREDKLCIISRIGHDHVSVLGNTLEKIASEKAGIIQKGNHVIALSQEPEVNAVIQQRCKHMGAQLEWVDQTGDYQKTNDALAIKACEILAARDNWSFDTALAQSVLQQVFIPGRFEKRHLQNHLVILDGAHNPQKLSALKNRVVSEGKYPATIIISMGERRDIKECLEVLQPIAARIIATEFFTKEQDMPRRPVPSSELADIAKQFGLEVIEITAPSKAVQKATQFSEPIIVTGSFYLLGEVDKNF